MAAQTRSSTPKWVSRIFDIRVLQNIAQVAFVIVMVAAVSLLVTNVLSALAAQNATPTFGFMQNRAGFDIGESPEWYSSNEPYIAALIVGLINTFRIIIVGLILSTVLGIIGGIFLLSNNWLIRNISRAVVEALRNTPLIVQLFVWYFVIMFQLPIVQQSLTFPPESVAFIAFRWAAYIIALMLTFRLTRHGSVKRSLIGGGLYAAFFVVEAGFYLTMNYPDWRGVFGKSNVADPAFIAYLVISIGLIAAARLIRVSSRPLLTGIAIGQLIGGLLFYFGFVPSAALRMEIYPAVYANIRGIIFPEIIPTARFGVWAIFLAIALVIAIAQWFYFRRRTERTGQPFPVLAAALGLLVIFGVIGWLVVGATSRDITFPVEQDGQTVQLPIAEAREQGLITNENEGEYSDQPVLVYLPQRRGFNFSTGSRVSPEYMALLLGLSVYTAVYIAEIVRAGIQAVPYGQIEAARSMGLPNGKILRMIVLPQALRVIIPPLGNQYLNLAKNSSLAIAISYADLFLVMRQIMNQSGQSVSGIIIVMLSYLAMSLTISFFLNVYNRRTRLVGH